MAAFTLDRKALIAAALQQLPPGAEHICVLPATTFVKVTRVVNLVNAETTAASVTDDICPPGSVDLDSFEIAVFGNKGAKPSSSFVTWLLGQGHQCERVQLDNTPLTRALLDKYDIIILDWLVRPYSPAEAQIVLEWVEGGGGLMSMTGHVDNFTVVQRPNSLLAPMGLSYNSSKGFFNGPVTAWTQPHPLTDGITSISFYGGLYIDVADDSVGVNTVIATRPQGPVAVAQQRKAGRLFVFGDEWIEFDSEWQRYPQISRFWSNILGWLAQERVAATADQPRVHREPPA